MLLGFLMYWQFFVKTLTVYETGTGETAEITLPDGNSIIQLASNSKIQFAHEGWEDSRTVELEGRAYFIAAVGKRFQVKFKRGTVKVLGTRFEINSNDVIVNIRCFEGTIQATNDISGTVHILKEKEELISSSKGNWEKSGFDESIPSWLDGTNTFQNVPLFHVIDILESIYGIKVIDNGTDLERLYSGTFPSDDLSLSLELIFQPFGIEYEKDNDRIILSP